MVCSVVSVNLFINSRNLIKRTAHFCAILVVATPIPNLVIMDPLKKIQIIGGGTVFHVRNHLALTAPAYGKTACKLYRLCQDIDRECDYEPDIHLTKMASSGLSNLETNEDVSKLVDTWIADPETKIIFFNVALVDFQGSIATSGAVGYEWSNEIYTPSGKYEERLKTSQGSKLMLLEPAPKILSKIRKERKDIFLVGFKTTCGATEDEQF